MFCSQTPQPARNAIQTAPARQSRVVAQCHRPQISAGTNAQYISGVPISRISRVQLVAPHPVTFDGA